MYELIQVPTLLWLNALGSPNSNQLKQVTGRTAGSDIQDTQATISKRSIDSIRDIILEFLVNCEVPPEGAPYDTQLHELALKEWQRKGYPPLDSALSKYFHTAVIIVSTAYSHISGEALRNFLVIYTTFIVYVDDTYSTHIDGIDCFHERFLSHQQQKNKVLDAFANTLQELARFYHSVQAHLILTSSLNFVSGTILEHQTKDMSISRDAKSYPTYQRIMTGVAEGYALLIFPPDMPVKDYVQAIPEICLIVNNLNDLLSFYKEERVGEQVNFISNEATARNIDKFVALRALSHDLVLCVSRIRCTLSINVEALQAFNNFLQGYTSYHFTSDNRYHLSDLLL